MHTLEDHAALTRVIDALYAAQRSVLRLDVVIRAELADVGEDALSIVNLLPPGTYTRQRLCDQLNSAITAHGWGRSLGTFE
ncbi:MAG TPA: hypothetical protein VFE45_14000 [Coriobacteriia bacterium]|nr:hypothetical protein [Coriobacteriia bacterium]